MRVLVIDDDNRMNTPVRSALTRAGWHVILRVAGPVGPTQSLAHPDAIVLDVSRPEPDGVAICRGLRRTDKHTPILIVTVRGGVEDRVAGLEAGADDYMVKPFSVAELQARVAAIVRRSTTVMSRGVTDSCVTSRRGERLTSG